MNQNRSQIYAAAGTLAVACLVLLWLMLGQLTFSPAEPQKPGIVLADVEEEEFVEVLEEEMPAPSSDTEAAPADNPVQENNDAVATPASGHDLTDNGPKGEPQPPVTAKRPSEVKEQKPKGPSKEEIAAQEQKKKEEEARRKANQQMANAFSNSGGSNNTDNKGRNPGNAGKPSANNSGTNGVGVRGSGGGKWGLPKSTAVVMQTPGKITFTCTINPDGSVAGLDVVPAQTDSEYVGNSRVINALKAEIRGFIKRQASKVKETEPRTARIVYTIR